MPCLYLPHKTGNIKLTEKSYLQAGPGPHQEKTLLTLFKAFYNSVVKVTGSGEAPANRLVASTARGPGGPLSSIGFWGQEEVWGLGAWGLPCTGSPAPWTWSLGRRLLLHHGPLFAPPMAVLVHHSSPATGPGSRSPGPSYRRWSASPPAPRPGQALSSRHIQSPNLFCYEALIHLKPSPQTGSRRRTRPRTPTLRCPPSP